ncbi:MAG: HAMP domain-containing protein, partial [Chloroflexi bacterium]|nr:HAMP domain-containing protein [Chloroflexota bacterium]
MKLTHKLTLAFLLVSLIAIGLAALFVQAATSTEFNLYLSGQRQAEFIAAASDYYKSNRRWAGVDTVLRKQGLLPPFPEPGQAPPDPQPYALVDQNLEVVIPAGKYLIGQKIQKSELDQGVSIELNGLVVGTLLITGQTPNRTPLEEKYLTSVNQSLLVAALGGSLIALLLGLFLARSLTHPLRDLTVATHAMAQGKLEQQVPVRSADELGELAAAFNQMSADLARANQSRKQMTADIAHDLRNPLTVIGGYLESLRDGVLKATPQRFDTMYTEVQHLQRLVEDLRLLSLADAGELVLHRQPVTPNELLQRAAAAYQHQAEQQGIQLSVDAEDVLPEMN